jgi:REP element-mobilizing transposase RayT
MLSGRRYPQRKRTRHAAAAYADTSAIASITIATFKRSRISADEAFTVAGVEFLRSRAATSGVALHAFCFMPDHLHLLIAPSPEVSIIAFVRRVKSLSTRLYWEHGYRRSD